MSTQVPLLLRVHCRPEAGALRRCPLPPVSASVCSDVGAPRFDSDDPPGENTVSQGGRCAWPAGNLASRSASRFQSARLRRACVRAHTRVCARRGAVSGKTQSRGCAPCRAPGLECVTAVAQTLGPLTRVASCCGDIATITLQGTGGVRCGGISAQTTVPTEFLHRRKTRAAASAEARGAQSESPRVELGGREIPHETSLSGPPKCNFFPGEVDCVLWFRCMQMMPLPKMGCSCHRRRGAFTTVALTRGSPGPAENWATDNRSHFILIDNVSVRLFAAWDVANARGNPTVNGPATSAT